jgi:glucokinase
MRAGEIGHISIDYKGIPCSCGNRGCLERYICIPAICQEAAKILGQESADFETVCRAYAQGHAGIVEMLCGKARLLAVGISNLIAAHPVTHIVLGGGIEQLGDRFLEQVQQAVQTVGFRKYMNRLTVTYTVSPSGNGALGAVWNYMYHQMKIEHVLKK